MIATQSVSAFGAAAGRELPAGELPPGNQPGDREGQHESREVPLHILVSFPSRPFPRPRLSAAKQLARMRQGSPPMSRFPSPRQVQEMNPEHLGIVEVLAFVGTCRSGVRLDEGSASEPVQVGAGWQAVDVRTTGSTACPIARASELLAEALVHHHPPHHSRRLPDFQRDRRRCAGPISSSTCQVSSSNAALLADGGGIAVREWR